MTSTMKPGTATPALAAGAVPADTSFPGITVTGVCMIAAPPLAVAGAATGISWYAARGIAFMDGMAAHHTLAAVGFNLVLAAMMLLLVAVIGLARMICATYPRLGRTGGIATVVGLCGPLFFNGVYFAGFQLAGTSGQAAGAVAMDQAQIIPRIVMNVSGPALVLGFVLLAVGAAKAGVLSRPTAWALGLTCIIPAGFISGYLAIAMVAFAGTAVALVPLGFRLLREPVR